MLKNIEKAKKIIYNNIVGLSDKKSETKNSVKSWAVVPKTLDKGVRLMGQEYIIYFMILLLLLVITVKK